MSQQDDFLRKAAVLIATLDDQAAEVLLDQIGREQAASLRRMLGELAPIGPQERVEVLEAFLQAGQSICPPCDADGVEVDESLAARFAADVRFPLEAEDAEEPAEPLAAQLPTFLRGIPAEALGELLAGEHPQTISVVLSQLAPATAADTLQRLAPELQGEVLRRLSQLNHTPPEVLTEIEQELQRLFQHGLALREAPAGVAAMRAIVQAAQPPEREALLAALERSDPALRRRIGGAGEGHSRSSTAAPVSAAERAEGRSQCRTDQAAAPRARAPRPAARTSPARPAAASQPRTLEFHDLAGLDDQGLAEVFRRADPQVALLALTGAAPALIDRIRRQLPWREARDLKLQMERLGPLRLSDVELAQQQLAGLAGQLISAGVLAAPRCRGFTGAA